MTSDGPCPDLVGPLVVSGGDTAEAAVAVQWHILKC